MTQPQTSELTGWAIVEIMGHQKYVGEVSTAQFGGTSMLRVDVPAIEEHAAFSKIFGWQSVFCLTPVTEEIGRALAGSYRAAPFNTYDLPREWQDAVKANRQAKIAVQSAGVPLDDGEASRCFDSEDEDDYGDEELDEEE